MFKLLLLAVLGVSQVVNGKKVFTPGEEIKILVDNVSPFQNPVETYR